MEKFYALSFKYKGKESRITLVALYLGSLANYRVTR